MAGLERELGALCDRRKPISAWRPPAVPGQLRGGAHAGPRARSRRTSGVALGGRL